MSGIIFSLLSLMVQWAHTAFTPRLTLFRQEPIVWRTFAFAVALAAARPPAAGRHRAEGAFSGGERPRLRRPRTGLPPGPAQRAGAGTGDRGPARITGQDGVVRVLMRLPDGEAFLRTSLDDVIAAANSPAVLLRPRGLLRPLCACHTFPDETPTRRLDRAESELAERFPAVWSETV